MLLKSALQLPVSRELLLQLVTGYQINLYRQFMWRFDHRVVHGRATFVDLRLKLRHMLWIGILKLRIRIVGICAAFLQ